MITACRSSVLLAMAILGLMAGNAVAQDDDSFPLETLQPKTETGLARFLEAHPEYDGRGTVVAIFDTGVDPGAPGLQVTSDGKPKIVDLIDGSGSGDVRLTEPKPAEDGKIQGATGRMLSLGPHKSPTNEYRLGMKPAWEIYPRGLVRRSKQERKDRWEEGQREVLASARAELATWERENPDPADEVALAGEELESRVELLEKLAKDYDDPGPIFDCVVFHDGTHWRALIDTDEDGDLDDEKAMTNFRTEREWDTFGDETLLNFAVNIYEDGALLSIVADCGSHGTHVAGTVAAFDPDHPELNGMAPGAQIIGVKIGDTRLGSSSVETGESRGIVASLENNCDLVNMSYGGTSALPNAGHIVDLYNEFVYEQGVIFVSSAGNEGPGLSSAGAPGATTSALIGVGAYVSGEMMTGQDAMREKHPDKHYTWSSRGPTLDGALGPDFSAPGGAISTVPNWSLNPNQLMHGTSMASPNVCGGIACLISGLKAEGRDYTPQSVRRALANTAIDVPTTDRFALGTGLVQFDRAWDLLVENPPYSPQGVRFNVSVRDRDGGRGVYLREPWETTDTSEWNVRVDPVFHPDVDKSERVDFQLKVRLRTEASWIRIPKHVHLTDGGRSFRILVDPKELPPGVHYAEVIGVDESRKKQGPIFRVPVTVIRTHPVLRGDVSASETLVFGSGEIHRRFFAVPPGATWAELRLRAGEHDAERSLVVHAVQIEPGWAFSDTDHRSYGWMKRGEERHDVFPVIGGRTLEVALAHHHSSEEPAQFSYELEFRGLVPSANTITLNGALPSTPVTVTATLADETIEPRGSFTHRRVSLRPQHYELEPLPGTRDLLPKEKRIHALVLTYELEMEKKGKVRLQPALSADGRFWDHWQSGLWMIFHEDGRHIRSGSWGETELEKGKYEIRYFVRHPDPARLDEIKELALEVDCKLSSPVPLSVYSDPDLALSDGGKFGSRTLAAGERATLWIGSPVATEFPDDVKSGDLLRGEIHYGKDETSSPERPEGYEIFVRVPDKPKVERRTGAAAGAAVFVDAKSDDEAKPDSKAKSSTDDEDTSLEEELVDIQVDHLKKLRKDERGDDFDVLARRLLRADPGQLAVRMEVIRKEWDDADEMEDASSTQAQRNQAYRTVVSACEALITRVNEDELAARTTLEPDPEDKDAVKAHDEAKETKGFLVEAHQTRCRALLELANAESPNAASSNAVSEFDRTFRQLDRWVDDDDKDSLHLRAAWEAQRGRHAKALALIRKKIESEPGDEKLHAMQRSWFEELGWVDWADYSERWRLLKMPRTDLNF